MSCFRLVIELFTRCRVREWYRELKKNGYDSKRAKRKDIGKKNIDDNTVKIVASLVKTGIRENGKKTMPVNVALDVLKRNG